MNKVLIELYVPSLGKNYDVYIPLTSRVAEVKILLAKAIGDLSEGGYPPMNEVLLCDYTTGKEYDVNLKVYELGIDNGSKLMLI